MNKALILFRRLGSITLSLVLFFAAVCILSGFKLDRQEFVTISGRVIFDDYRSKPIIVLVFSDLLKDYSKYINQIPILENGQEERAGKIGAIFVGGERARYNNFLSMPKPGKYRIRVPKNFGEINIVAINETFEYVKKLASFDKKEVVIGWYPDNPITVATSNIYGIDINMRPPLIAMSGEVIFREYLKGPITISALKEASSGGALDEAISSTSIAKPGRFTIDVPKNIGNIYLNAWNSPKGEKGGKPTATDNFGQAIENPIKVGSSDIENIAIILDKE
ncbi:MAG: hypothetical protein ISS47_01615 [Candidatus Omnitrophica bacterium]|nr:hypothetical protein [Candidatus Omnitrophota bacterium]